MFCKLFYIFSTMKNWKDKIHMNTTFKSKPLFVSDNAFGLFFEMDKDRCVYFKPLNESFSSSLHENSKGTLLYFEREFIEEDDEEYALDILSLFKRSSEGVFQIAAKEFPGIRTVLGLIEEEYNTQENAYLILKSLLKVLLLKLIRQLHNGYLKQDVHQKRVLLFLQLMERHYLQETSGGYYAQQMGISEKRLNQILKDKLELTAKQVIQQRQVTEIKRMIKQNAITLKEMAFYFGFESLSSFSRFFKRHTLKSPSQFKAEFES